MSKYTNIVDHAQPVAYYKFNDFSGDIVDNVNALNFADNSEILYQQTGALLGETDNKAIALYGILETPNTITCYVNGVFEFTDNIQFTMTGFDSIGGAGSDINIDEVIIYDDTRLRDYEISQLYSRATYSVDNSIGWRITGVTQVAGLNTSVDLRLFHHDTGALLTQITSNNTGYYEITGLLEGVLYDVVAWQEADIATCQHINMGVLPEQYTY